ncbi:MAG: YjdF family protein [Sedimentibacter sp.]|uniref:YjdF family protein n=1 Tax=Sedimentibacter sp. TaxID=1960295 RepID=UPI0031582789
MNKVTGRLQVFFEEPFWVGIFERVDNDKLSVCKITFGAEPKDYEVQAFILENYHRLRFSPSVDSIVEEKERINPKRLQREVKKQINNAGIGSKSQQALKLQQEQGKLERKAYSREQNEAKKEFQYKLKQQKRREKHKGR